MKNEELAILHAKPPLGGHADTRNCHAKVKCHCEEAFRQLANADEAISPSKQPLSPSVIVKNLNADPSLREYSSLRMTI